MSGWQAVFETLKDDNFIIIAAAQDSAGAEAAAPWYERAGAEYISLVDTQHTLSSLYNLVNVPSAVWIDEAGNVRRIDEGTYATIHKMGDFQFGREDYAPMVANWVKEGEASRYLPPAGSVAVAPPSDDEAIAEANFKLAVYFFGAGDQDRADRYWGIAQSLNPASWNYARQDWSFTPEVAGENWTKKVQTLEGKPYYRPIEGLDKP